MCAPSQGAMLPYGLKVPSPYFPFGPSGSLTQAHLSALDFQRSQLNDYNVRMQFGLRNYPNSIGLSPFHAYINDPYTQAYFYKHDQRGRFVQEEPKPSHSYIGLIGMAILSSKDKKLVLSDIYQWILDNYAYFRTRGPGWRNSIRHNLSLNDCFIKAGRSANGKGYYWAVHPANVEDFERGDFRRRRAQRKVRRHMGLSVPDDDDSPTPSPTQTWPHHDIVQETDRGHLDTLASPDESALRSNFPRSDSEHVVFCHPTPIYGHLHVQAKKPSRKRLFDMASLLAPDDDKDDIKHEDQQTNIERLSSDKIHHLNFNVIQHELKSQDKTAEAPIEGVQSNESYPYDDVNVDINSPLSGSGREMNDDSEDDGENYEIQVTSEDDSPGHGQGLPFDVGEVQSGSDTYQNSPRNKSSTESKLYLEKDDQMQSTWSSNPYRTDSKTENALDLSSSNHPEDENHMDMIYIKSRQYKMFGLHSSDKDCDFRQLQLAGKSGHGLTKMETDLESSNGYTNFNPSGNSCIASLSKISRKDCELEKPNESDDNLTKLFHNDRFRHRAELSHENSSDVDHLQRAANNKLTCYRPEVQETNGQQAQEHRVSNPGALGNRQSEPDQRMRAEKMGYTSDVPISESVRISSDHVDWVEMSKNALIKDRLSAFSALGIRNQCVYSPLQLRNLPLSTHRLLPKAIPMRVGVPSPLMPVDTPPLSQISIPKELDTGFSKCNYKIASNICSSTPVDGTSK